VEIGSNEIVIQTTLNISNRNDFEIITKNFELLTTTPDGKRIAYLKIEGGIIPANGMKRFNDSFNVDFNGNTPDLLKTRVSGVFGMSIWFIQKTLPISVNTVTQINDFTSNFVPPTFVMAVDFGEITQHAINMTMNMSVYNPNTFDIKVEELLVKIEDETGLNVGSLNFPDMSLKAKKTISVDGRGSVVIGVLNAKILSAKINSEVKATIAGYEKSLPILIETNINVPDLKTLLPSTKPTLAVIKGDFRVSFRGLVAEITLETVNPNNIEFFAKDITISIARVDRNTKRTVADGTIEGGVIKVNDTTLFKGDVIIPYSKLFIPPPGGKIIPDWLEVTLITNVTIQGLNTYFWIGVVGYQDFYLFR
jgi:LEA14-like dessication related protein